MWRTRRFLTLLRWQQLSGHWRNPDSSLAAQVTRFKKGGERPLLCADVSVSPSSRVQVRPLLCLGCRRHWTPSGGQRAWLPSVVIKCEGDPRAQTAGPSPQPPHPRPPAGTALSGVTRGSLSTAPGERDQKVRLGL